MNQIGIRIYYQEMEQKTKLISSLQYKIQSNFGLISKINAFAVYCNVIGIIQRLDK